MVAQAHGSHVSIAAKDIPLCQRFPEKHLPCLLDAGDELDYAAGQPISMAGDGAVVLFVVTDGAARAILSAPEKAGSPSAVVQLLRPGDLYGLVPALHNKPSLTGLEAVTASRVLVVKKADFLRELEQHPETAAALLKQLAEQVRTHQEWLVSAL